VKLAFASDHAGYDLKERLAARARELGHEVLDLGVHSHDSVDYPEYGIACGEAVVGGRAELGVVVCGSGIGIAIAANKVPGCRAALAHDHFTAEMSRRHNDANVLALGARVVGEGVALDALEKFLSTPFEGGRHAARVAKIESSLESKR